MRQEESPGERHSARDGFVASGVHDIGRGFRDAWHGRAQEAGEVDSLSFCRHVRVSIDPSLSDASVCGGMSFIRRAPTRGAIVVAVMAERLR
jgi:hypothetical protein